MANAEQYREATTMGFALIRIFRRSASAFGLLSILAVGLSGCAGTIVFPDSSTSQVLSTPIGHLQGSTYGGQQPIWNAHVYLMKASTSGYKTSSTSILTAGANTTKDANGNYYVTTNGYGNFDITGDYTCNYNATTPSQSDQLYLVSLGGNATYMPPGSNPTGGATNAYIGLMSVLGSCPATGSFAGKISFIYMNEVSTVAAAYALAGFAGNSTSVGSSSSAQAQIGLANAFANANQLYDIQNIEDPINHEARQTTPSANGSIGGVVPYKLINTLGNILANCINQGATAAVPTSGACLTLYNKTGNSPDTASAMIYIAQHPGANVGSLYALQAGYVQFPDALASQPNDFTVGINYVGTSTANPTDVAIDANGYAWVTSGSGAVLKLTPTGTHATGSPFNLQNANYLSVDPSGNVWVTAGSLVYEMSNTGGTMAGSPFSNGLLGSGLATIATDATSAYVASPNSGLNLLGINTPGQLVKITPSGGSATWGVFYTGITGLLGGAALNNLPYVSQVASGNKNSSGDPTLWASGDTNSCLLVLSVCGGLAVQQLDETTTFPTSLILSIPTWTTSSFIATNNSISYTCNVLILFCNSVETPGSLAVDSANTGWISVTGNTSNGGVDELARVTTGGTVTSLLTGNGINNPQGVAVDGSGNVFVVSEGANSLLQYSGSAFVTGTSGYTGASNGMTPATLLNTPTRLDIDPSGNVWVVNAAGSSGYVTEYLGLATPVVRPLSAAGITNSLGTKP
jgi:streptogramin lyase